MSSVRESAFNGTKWAAIEKFSVQGIRFVMGILMARLLSPSDYGLISMILLFIVLSDVFVDSGFTNALIRTKNPTDKDYSTVFYFNIFIAITCYIIIWFSAPLVARFFNHDILCSVLRILSVTIIINSLFSVQMTRLTIDLKFKNIAICNTCASLISGILGLTFAYIGFGVWALVFQTICSCIITLLCTFFFCRWLPLPHFFKESFQRMFSYGSKLLVSNLINKVYQNISTILIGKFYTAKDLGLYDRGSSLAAFIPDNANSIMSKVSFPILAKLQDDEVRLITVYKKYIKMLSIVIFFLSIIVAALAKPIIVFMLGTKWIGAVIFLQIVTFCFCFQHIDTINLNLLFVKGRSDLVLRLEFIKKGISIIALILLLPFGVVAICFSRVIFMFTTIICDSYYTGKFYEYGFFSQVRDVAPYFIKSIMAALPAFILSYANIIPVLSITLGFFGGMVLYYYMLRKDSSMIELKSIFIEKLKHDKKDS